MNRQRAMGPIILALALTLTACAPGMEPETEIEGSSEQAAASTTVQFQWIPAISATGIEGGAKAAIGGTAGLFGVSGTLNTGLFGVTLPVGSRITKLGVRFRHAAGEVPGGPGAVVLAGLWRSGGNVQGDNNVELLPASPPAANPSYTLFVGASATPVWEEKIVTLDSARTLISNSFVYQIGVIFSGPIVLEAVGYEYVPVR